VSPLVPTGGRTWWAHVEFTRINIEPPIIRKRMEDDLACERSGVVPGEDPPGAVGAEAPQAVVIERAARTTH